MPGASRFAARTHRAKESSGMALKAPLVFAFYAYRKLLKEVDVLSLSALCQCL